MPIYEFRCLECNEISEILFMNSDDVRELKCTQCNSRELERVMSTSNYNMGSSPAGPQTSSESRTCSGGSCSTLEIPGKYD